MKRFKYFLAVMLAIVVGLASLTPAHALTQDGTLTIKGLETGDTVKLYKVLEFDDAATTTHGWKLVSPFQLTDTELAAVIGNKTGTSGTIGQISAEVAGKLGGQITATTPTAYGPLSVSGGKAEVTTGVQAGLYIAIITPKAGANYIYNPVFVSADYFANSSNEWTVNLDASYGNNALAKKCTVTVDKKAGNIDGKKPYEQTNPEVGAVGDTLGFVVQMTIPGFAANYTNPVFKITDELTGGLTLDQGSIKVYAGTVEIADIATATEIAASNYSLSGLGDHGYTLQFTKDYLRTVVVNQPVTVYYEAEITDDAITTINTNDNTVTVKYSNTPDDEEGHGILRDKTEHYTFTIDGNLLGGTSGQYPEVIKVGVDAAGAPIYQETMHYTDEVVSALDGAEFKLYTDQACTQEYTNDILTPGKKIVSANGGYLTIQGEDTPGIRGLDAGTYYLLETKAPDGFIRQTTPVKIEITAYFKTVAHTDTETYTYNGVEKTVEVTYNVTELDYYTVKINDVMTSAYTFQNTATGPTVTPVDETPAGEEVTDVNDVNHAGEIINTEGVELPSTGGIGTTIFYVIGGAMVVCGIVMLITKRRLAKIEE